MNILNNLIIVFDSIWRQLAGFLPNIVAAMAVFIIGILLAGLLGKLVTQILQKLYLDRITEKVGLRNNLNKIGFRPSISQALGWLVTGFFDVVFLIVAADILQLPQIADFLQTFVLYIPSVIVAVVIIVIGMVVASFVQLLVRETALAAKLEAAEFLAALTKWVVLVFTFMAALIQLRVAPELIQILFAGFVFMLALAGGIAFGLASQDRAKKLLDRLSRK